MRVGGVCESGRSLQEWEESVRVGGVCRRGRSLYR